MTSISNYSTTSDALSLSNCEPVAPRYCCSLINCTMMQSNNSVQELCATELDIGHSATPKHVVSSSADSRSIAISHCHTPLLRLLCSSE
eukprot:13561-Heterococcus_DN1.PRE.1